MPWYKVVKINPGGKALLFDGEDFSRHSLATKADPQKAEHEQIYIQRLRKEEEKERAKAVRAAKKKRRKK